MNNASGVHSGRFPARLRSRVLRRTTLVSGAALSASLLFGTDASAHLVDTGFGTFYDGLVHLVITPADALFVLGLAFLAGMNGPQRARAVLVILPLTWMLLGLVGMHWPLGSPWPWLAVVTFGLAGILVALDAKLSKTLLLTIAVLGGAWHGLVNGSAMAQAGLDWLSILGASTAVFVAVTVLSALVTTLQRPWTRIVVRVAGSWLVAISTLMIGWIVKRGL